MGKIKQEESNNGNKPSWKQVYELLSPLQEDVTTIKTLLSTHLKSYDEYCKDNVIEHKIMQKSIISKISIKAFIGWLSGASLIVGAILGLLNYFK